MSTPRTVAFHTLGCKLNYSETTSIGKLFQQAGYEEVDFDKCSDIYVINTCSVTEQADKKCRKIVRSAIKQNAQARVIVIGCYAQLKPEEIANIPGVSMVLGAAEKFNILDHIHSADNTSPHTNIHHTPIYDVQTFIPSHSIETRTRSFLKIQDGCDYKCSFCTIPLARGSSRSGTINSIIQSCKELLAKGIKEIVLTGVNIGDFGNGTAVIEGSKIKKQALFIDLIRELDTISGNHRFRISSIEPNLCTEEIIDFVAASTHFMPHFHMPLQSGDNDILSAMRRRYKRELYRERVLYIKQRMPHACIGVDVIVGFPGETDTHFNNTCQFIESLDISYLHVFSYSERDNTPAAYFTNQVNPEVRHHRSRTLQRLSDLKKQQFYTPFAGTVQNVLVENKTEGNYLSGFTPNYLRVLVENNTQHVNKYLTVRLEKLNRELLFTSAIEQHSN